MGKRRTGGGGYRGWVCSLMGVVGIKVRRRKKMCVPELGSFV